MAKKPNPAKLIKKRARKLVLHRCMVNANWGESQMANVIIIRKHSNGNFTICTYLVDLMCLGVKDTFYSFNKTELEIEEMLDYFLLQGEMIEIDYDLAHNIIFAGYEFALNCGIEPHEDFEKVTKYMLEKDDENVPLIDVEVGENGTPHYMQNEEENASFAGKIIRSLEENVGKGNFLVTRYEELEEDFPEDLEDLEDDDDLWRFYEDEDDLMGDFEDDGDLWNYLDDEDLDIAQVAHQFLSYFKEEELSEDDEFKFNACSFILMKHYIENKRVEKLLESWETDMKVMPSFEYELGLSKKTNPKIDTIAQKADTILSQKEIKFLKENLSNQALVGYIELVTSIPEVDPISQEIKDEKFDAYMERKEKLQKKHPDFPLFKLQTLLPDINMEDFTFEKTFEKDYTPSQFEFEEYIQLKFDTIVQKGDLNALIAFGFILDSVAIGEESIESLKEAFEVFQNLMLFYRVANDYFDDFE